MGKNGLREVWRLSKLFRVHARRNFRFLTVSIQVAHKLTRLPGISKFSMKQKRSTLVGIRNVQDLHESTRYYERFLVFGWIQGWQSVIFLKNISSNFLT